MRRTQKIGLISLTFFASLLAVMAHSLRHSSSRSEIAINHQVSSDIENAVALNLSSTSFREWKASGYTPHDIFKNVEALSSWEAVLNLCDELWALSDEDLALYDDQLREFSNLLTQAPRCAPGNTPDLRQKLSRHWQKQSQDFYSRNGSSTPVRSTSIEKRIDPTQLRVINGELLHPGEVALIFDEGPHSSRTERIRKILNENGVRALFFEFGRKAEENPQLVKRTALDGHVIGSLSFEAHDLTALDLGVAQNQILNGHRAIRMVTDQDSRLFRFPDNLSTVDLDQFLAKQNLIRVSSSIDSADYRLRNPQKLFDHLLSSLNAHKGGIVLFHDQFEQTVIILPAFLKALQDRHFQTVVFVPNTGDPGRVPKTPKTLAGLPHPKDRHPLSVEH